MHGLDHAVRAAPTLVVLSIFAIREAVAQRTRQLWPQCLEPGGDYPATQSLNLFCEEFSGVKSERRGRRIGSIGAEISLDGFHGVCAAQVKIEVTEFVERIIQLKLGRLPLPGHSPEIGGL